MGGAGSSDAVQAKLEQAWATIIEALGYDLTSPHLADSPRRVAKFLRTWHTQQATPPVLTVFPPGEYTGIVLVKDVPFYSLCAHHGLPFMGSASIAYIPSEVGVCGLSKFARVVDYFAHRFQVQEELTAQIADHLQAVLKPVGLAVQMQAEHLCMAMRGVERPGCGTITSDVRGVFRTDAAARAEVLKLMER